MTEKTKVSLKYEVTLSKPVPELSDLAGGRIYTIDGVENVSTLLNLEPVSFAANIRKFNAMYKLSGWDRTYPGLHAEDTVKRLYDLKNILSEELDEIDDIIEKLEYDEYSSIEHCLTDIADLLGDIQVYCASEMQRHGLDNDQVLRIIMNSNFSKLDADGNPIYDLRGKVMKGPGYWKPEPMILTYIQDAVRIAQMETAEQGEDDAS